jgi:Fe-S cluster biosynthesis and repair protein YggX
MPDIQCTRCGETRPAQPFAPFNSDFGRRIHAEICQECWGQWLRQQTMLINHYGLNVRDPDARKFLLENTEKFLFGSGDTEDIDTTRQGTISW